MTPLEQVNAVDWMAVSADLDAQGRAVLDGLVGDREGGAIMGTYDGGKGSRSHVAMADTVSGRESIATSAIRCPISCRNSGRRFISCWCESQTPGTRGWEIQSASLLNTRNSRAAAMKRGRLGPRRSCCNMAPATTTAYTRIYMANTFSRCRWQPCCLNRARTSREGSSC
jgi:hypothetical protein